ncbi:MAG: peptide-methionine (S)-S-oxide reductase [Candidatus Doudnabacteria bacterium RIFCSPHIGHO2_01_FULL_49_9]|uniref:Peptide methionine sulfoxide reductase MsrA n=1 Tax=Candidatus Doudnabacteria bacterium RIFCSPHIGHO2_01_FULL_49_9 TaxID=1817827 RepID=A0A1F5NY51_9BACT|nr:MAG: peptide-methionine (S)-S-oxide reductase [Candidatus Doudnabacteria bacterium RIFCSPHIGHO2_01_FULL_49_9]
MAAASKLETVVFGGGCFWCTEAIFAELKGVVSVIPGYAGGESDKPNYDQVSGGGTGHAEVIKIEFDPSIISFHDLLEVFFATHDPTTPNQQGADVGTQYRSLILYTTPEQKTEAEKLLQLNFVTEIKPLDRFYDAEEYHKNYYNNNQSAPYCQLVINPKLDKFRQQFGILRK